MMWIVISLFLALLLIRHQVVKTGYFDRLFDERQRRIWSEANKLTLYGILVWSSLLWLASWFQEARLSLDFFYSSTIFVGAFLQQAYRIWKGAYLPWNKQVNWGDELGYNLFLAVLNAWMLATNYSYQGSGLATYLLQTDGAILFFSTLLFSSLFLVCLVKWVMEKGTESED